MPLISKCIICDRGLNSNDKEIHCDKCRSPIHTTCSGLSRAEANLTINNEKRRSTFHCDFCVNERKTITDLRELITDLKREIEELKQKAATPSFENQPSDLIEAVITEVNERNKRANNIIISNLQESDNSTEEERYTADLSKVKSLICNDGVARQTDVLKCFRIGKAYGDRAHPIKVVLSSAEVSKTVTSKYRSTNGIYVNRDLTKLQQEKAYNVRMEFKNRLSNGESNIKLRYFDGIPKMVEKN